MAWHNEGHIFRNNRVVNRQPYKATACGPARHDRYHGSVTEDVAKGLG